MSGDGSHTFIERLGIDWPIVQAPMAGVSSPEMAAAVSNAGGLGSIGVGATDAAGADRMIAAFRALSERSINVNVFCHRPATIDNDVQGRWLKRLKPEFDHLGAAPPDRLTEIYKSFVDDDDMLSLLIAERPKVVSFHFGVPSSARISALRDAGILLFASATNLEEARMVSAAGVDAVIAQGIEAGGHRGVFDPDAPDGQLETAPLTSLLVREVGLPVIAAGGLMHGGDIAAMLRRGASAAQLGTAFIATPESLADAGYRKALKSEAAYNTVITRAISGRPARALANRFTAFGAGVSPAEIPSYPVAYDAGKALHAAAKAVNEHAYGAHWAGMGAPRARELPAAALIALLVAEMQAA